MEIDLYGKNHNNRQNDYSKHFKREFESQATVFYRLTPRKNHLAKMIKLWYNNQRVMTKK
jgi:hypothetical protein